MMTLSNFLQKMKEFEAYPDHEFYFLSIVDSSLLPINTIEQKGIPDISSINDCIVFHSSKRTKSNTVDKIIKKLYKIITTKEKAEELNVVYFNSITNEYGFIFNDLNVFDICEKNKRIQCRIVLQDLL